MIVNGADCVFTPWVPVIVAVVVDATADVVIVNVAEVDPAATVTVPGAVALVVPVVMLTAIPPVGAFPLIVTLPVDELPPITDAGATVRLISAGESMVRVAVLVTLPSVPVMVEVAANATGVVVIVNVADEAPAATVTLAGVVAAALLDESDTTSPPVPAGPLSVTVPVELIPPITVEGATETLVSDAGLMVRVAFALAPP